MKYNQSIFNVPLVFQFNKIDLVKLNLPVLSSNILKHDLNNRLNKPYYLASALHGHNVASTLKKITALTIASIKYN
jgi:hypothetical protein